MAQKCQPRSLPAVEDLRSCLEVPFVVKASRNAKLFVCTFRSLPAVHMISHDPCVPVCLRVRARPNSSDLCDKDGNFASLLHGRVKSSCVTLAGGSTSYIRKFAYFSFTRCCRFVYCFFFEKSRWADHPDSHVLLLSLLGQTSITH